MQCEYCNLHVYIFVQTLSALHGRSFHENELFWSFVNPHRSIGRLGIFELDVGAARYGRRLHHSFAAIHTQLKYKFTGIHSACGFEQWRSSCGRQGSAIRTEEIDVFSAHFSVYSNLHSEYTTHRMATGHDNDWTWFIHFACGLWGLCDLCMNKHMMRHHRPPQEWCDTRNKYIEPKQNSHEIIVPTPWPTVAKVSQSYVTECP